MLCTLCNILESPGFGPPPFGFSLRSERTVYIWQAGQSLSLLRGVEIHNNDTLASVIISRPMLDIQN